jgi:hypothetical protein
MPATGVPQSGAREPHSTEDTTRASVPQAATLAGG